MFCPRGIDITKAYAAPTDALEVSCGVARGTPAQHRPAAQIYYMQAPAFEGMFGDLFKSIGGYHTAFGIINRACVLLLRCPPCAARSCGTGSTGKTYTLEYDAVSEVLKLRRAWLWCLVLSLTIWAPPQSATLPIVTKLPNGTVQLDWYNGGSLLPLCAPSLLSPPPDWPLHCKATTACSLA